MVLESKLVSEFLFLNNKFFPACLFVPALRIWGRDNDVPSSLCMSL